MNNYKYFPESIISLYSNERGIYDIKGSSELKLFM